LLGLHGRLFAEVQPTADEAQFQLDNTSDRYYNSPYYLLHKDQLQPVPTPRTSPPRMDLGEVLGSDATAAVAGAKKISFHSVGDTGAAKVNHFQTAQQALAHEAGVADAMARDVHKGGATLPPSSSTSATSSTTSARGSTTTTSSTSRSATTTGRSSRSPATTTERSSATAPTCRRSRR
jgi:hypothetical protein